MVVDLEVFCDKAMVDSPTVTPLLSYSQITEASPNVATWY